MTQHNTTLSTGKRILLPKGTLYDLLYVAIFLCMLCGIADITAIVYICVLFGQVSTQTNLVAIMDEMAQQPSASTEFIEKATSAHNALVLQCQRLDYANKLTNFAFTMSIGLILTTVILMFVTYYTASKKRDKSQAIQKLSSDVATKL